MLFRTIQITVAIIVVSGLAFLGATLTELAFTPRYDNSDPDYARYASIFEHLNARSSRDGLTGAETLDLSHLNRGEWTRACVFAGYTNPLATMQVMGASINEMDRVRLTEAGSRGGRLGQVEESEAAIAYIDPANRAHFIHFERGLPAETQHFQRCISKPETSARIGPLY